MDDYFHQMTSAALHAVFLAICFAVPRSTVLEPVETELRFQRWVETRLQVDERFEPVERLVKVTHSPDVGFGSGVGNRDGSGAGPAWGGGVDRRAQAPALGPSSRSDSDLRVDRTRPEPEGPALDGDVGDESVTSERKRGELRDGADGGGGLGDAERADEVSGSGSGGSSSGCGCDGPMAPRGLNGIGQLGRNGEDARLVKTALGTDEKNDFIVPSVAASEPAISCDGCAAIIERIIRSHLREIRYCYELSLERDPRLEGQLDLSLSIPKRGGRPTRVAASPPMSDQKLRLCAEDRMSRWVFPALAHDARANFPVRLSSTTAF